MKHDENVSKFWTRSAKLIGVAFLSTQGLVAGATDIYSNEFEKSFGPHSAPALMTRTSPPVVASTDLWGNGFRKSFGTATGAVTDLNLSCVGGSGDFYEASGQRNPSRWRVAPQASRNAERDVGPARRVWPRLVCACRGLVDCNDCLKRRRISTSRVWAPCCTAGCTAWVFS